MPDERPLGLGARALHSLALYAAVLTIYFAPGLVARPPWTSVATPLDDAIPFAPWAVFGYALAYVVPVSLLFVETSAAGLQRMRRAVLLAYLIAAPFFVAMPVQDADPPIMAEQAVAADGELVLHWNRGLDRTKNAFPSMHVGLATLLALIGWRRSRSWGIGLGTAALLIALSTLLVKQHFLVDLPAGALVGWLAFRTVYGPAGWDGRTPEGPAAPEAPVAPERSEAR